MKMEWKETTVIPNVKSWESGDYRIVYDYVRGNTTNYVLTKYDDSEFNCMIFISRYKTANAAKNGAEKFSKSMEEKI